MDGSLDLEEVAIGGIVLFYSQIDKVGERLKNAFLQGTLQHMARVVTSLHSTLIQFILMMLEQVLVHGCDEGTDLWMEGQPPPQYHTISTLP